MRPVYEILGPLRVLRDGAELPVRAPKQLALLAVLLLRGNQPVARADVVRALWGRTPPDGAAGLVATYVSRLRTALEPGRPRRARPSRLLTRGSCYELRLERTDLDLWRFEDAAAAARAELRAGRPAAAADGYAAALRLWRGPALAELPGPFAHAERRRLAELRMTAVLERAQALYALGDAATAAAELAAPARAFPLHERLAALRMRALHESGRTAEALRVFHELRRALVRGLGVEPGPEMQALQRRVLGGAAGDPPREPPARGRQPA